ncbi:MAG: Kdo domain containing protein [Flavobacteriaceae bacterium]|nr:Kdo domain containing protein [Flavobacteriaceae bacterium]
MRRSHRIHPDYLAQEEDIHKLVETFDTRGSEIGDQDRNTLKSVDLNGQSIVIKSFRIPNLINRIAYRFFRKSKALRSFEHACKLQSLGIGTPAPIACYEFTTPFFFKRSFYISRHVDADLTYRNLTEDLNYPDHEKILRAFTGFTYELHQKGIKFLDHSPGNTLIRVFKHGYEFYLVDLNRMAFKEMKPDERIRNFERLTPHQSVVRIMSEEYAKLIDWDADEVFRKMWKNTEAFQTRFHRRRRLKKRLKFWKRS